MRALPGTLETIQPSLQFQHHLIMIGERLQTAEAMTACGIDVHGGRHLALAEFLVIKDAVEGWHRPVVIGKDDKGTGGRGSDMLLVTELVQQLTLRFLAQQILTGALMGSPLLHRYHRIEQYLEVCCGIAFGMSGDSRGKMPTCRESHDTHLSGIDVP